MLFGPDNFLTHIKNLVTGGGRDSNGVASNDCGFMRDVPVPLSALDLNTVILYDGDATGAPVEVTYGGAYLAADETNARVVMVEETIDDILQLTIPIPRDYDEATDEFRVRVLASMLTVSTDTDVELDMEAYIKTAGSALGADLNPTAPGVVLSTTEQWIEFNLSQNSLVRDSVLTLQLISNGANDTDGEEILIHAFEYVYRSTLVSYDDENDASGNALR